MTAEQSGTYTEFHRKYQPKIWDDFIGQDEIVAQLKRDIIEGRHVQGRLFQGKAGTGKSSTVKVFTKALNCENRPEGSADPCLVCESCVRFDNEKHGGMAYFVASEAGGVDKVRSIIQSGSIKQMMKAPFIIIDECHALSDQAWDALLAYLENKEGLETVPIIFCTTEMNKVKETIVTRVQSYNFKNIPVSTLEEYLYKVARVEGVELTSTGASWCARNAKGSARGALKCLEEYLRNPNMYDANEGVATSLLKYAIYGNLSGLYNGLERAKDISGALRAGTEEAMVLMTNYTFKLGKAQVPMDKLPFYDLQKQTFALHEMSKRVPEQVALEIIEMFQRVFKGIWNASDENDIFTIAWLKATLRMRAHLDTLNPAALQG